MLKSRMRWASLAACMGRRGMHTGFWWRKKEERYYKEDLDVGG
jgi:hypothetical protein